MNDMINIENNKNEKENNMNETKLPKVNHETNEQTITSLEVAEMLGMEHKLVLRKLEGRESKGKHIKGYIEILNENQMVPVDFFIKSTYKDSKGEMRPCYNVTKLGCEFLANKFTGEKGVLFTAKYVKRFHEMEDYIKEEKPKFEPLRDDQIMLDDFTDFTPKVPMVSDWYERNRGRMERMCTKCNKTWKYMYHCILERVGEKYDLQKANEIYKNEVGCYPKYPIDVIRYFPELGKEADKYLDRLEKNIYGL